MKEFQFETSEAGEAFELMMHLFEGRIDADEMSRLDLALRQHAPVRRLFMRVAHQYCALVPLIAVRGQGDPRSLLEALGRFEQVASDDNVLNDNVLNDNVLNDNVLSETMILPALREVEAGGDDQEETSIYQPAPFQLEDLKNRPRNISRLWYRIAMVIVVALLVTVTVIVTRRGDKLRDDKLRGDKLQQAVQQTVPKPPVISREPALATITATAGVIGVGPDIINPRTELIPGRVLNLAGGAVELTFATGVSVVVRGPAQLRVTDRNTLMLDTGSLYAHVPSSAIGFRVMAPGLGVVDRGTNFGVRVEPRASTSEVHVFEGRVDATALDASGKPGGSPVPVLAGVAVAHSASSPATALQPVPFQALGFDRDINRIQVDVPSHGTGAGLDAGSGDPQWQLISIPGVPDWKPAPAFVVTDPRPEYVPNSDKAKWISTSPQMESVAGGDYVYRTTIDLTGFDPASVSVVANFAVDDKIREIRVNGHAASLPRELTMGLDGGPARTTVHQLPLSNVKWLSGPNKVDVVVWNLEGYDNYTGLQLGWSISAAPIVMR